jgi:uncharacterized protein (DUF2236 family)
MERTRSPEFARHMDAVRMRLAASGLTRPGPGSVTWKVNREVVVVAGWGRAILLQFSHPLIAAGVADHSSFGRGLFSGFHRLFSTIRAMQALTFGDERQAIGAAAGINTIHDRVFGQIKHPAGSFASGAPYSAHDPELLQWVHATLLESLPMTYELLVGPLTPAERDRYCEESAIVEPLLAIPAGILPRRTDDLRTYMDEMGRRGRIAVSDTSRTLARQVLYPPLGPVLWPALRPVRLITIGLLPEAIREAYGFRWGAAEARALTRWVSILRSVRATLPAFMREWPVARAAARRRAPGSPHRPTVPAVSVPASGAPRPEPDR